MNLINVVFEKNGGLKLTISLLLCMLLGILYSITNEQLIYLWIASPFALWLALYSLISFYFAWFNIPVLWFIDLFKKK
jgi:hypothetical protein